MRKNKMKKEDMINLLGKAVLTYSLAIEKKIEISDSVPPMAMIIGFNCGREEMWTEACQKFINTMQAKLEAADAKNASA
jgi:fructose-1,6-bisphosphatase